MIGAKYMMNTNNAMISIIKLHLCIVLHTSYETRAFLEISLSITQLHSVTRLQTLNNGRISSQF